MLKLSMFKKILSILLLCALWVGLPHAAHAEPKPPIQLELRSEYGQHAGGKAFYIDIVSMVDAVTINDVVINRGNVSMGPQYRERMPKTLKFGEVYSIGLSGDQKILEVTANTDQGAWTRSFNR